MFNDYFFYNYYIIVFFICCLVFVLKIICDAFKNPKHNKKNYQQKNTYKNIHNKTIDELDKINKSFNDENEDLNKTQDKINKGMIGEELIVKEIEKLDIYHKIVQNVYIDIDNKKTEIDIILITCVGVFVIESKNFNGIIYGKQNDINWTQFLNYENKNQFKNPINQNEYHIKFLSKYLKKDISIFYSYIIFGNDANINKVITDDDIKVIKLYQLLKYITEDIHNNDICLSNEEIDKIYIDLKYYKDHSR